MIFTWVRYGKPDGIVSKIRTGEEDFAALQDVE